MWCKSCLSLIEILTILSTCEGVYGGCSALLSSSSRCHGDGVLSPGLKVDQSGGGFVLRYRHLGKEDTKAHIQLDFFKTTSK